jgi:ribosomal protein L37E
MTIAIPALGLGRGTKLGTVNLDQLFLDDLCDSCGSRSFDGAMAKRECSQCGGELVLAVRANQPQTNNDGPSLLTSAFTSWRCGTCGSAFTAAQLREDKRGRSKPTEHA